MYTLVSTLNIFTYDNTDENHLEEDIIFDKDISPLLEDLPKNTFKNCYYVFTEMMNNAIEHSESKKIQVLVEKNYLLTKIILVDYGVGIFKKIQDYYEKELGEKIKIEDVIVILTAGKFTTAKDKHSGEGIFFSSRVSDGFMIYSSNRCFCHTDFYEEIRTIMEGSLLKSGTSVYIKIYNHTKKNLREVFDMFANTDSGFIKTQIPIKHLFGNGYPVSRSQAKRLASSIDKFEEVTLDFDGVEDIGQAFAHELFKVYNKDNTKQINCINTNENVKFMIKRVLNTK